MSNPQETICPLCGSGKVLMDAMAIWSIERQAWTLHSTQPGNLICCEACGEDLSEDEIMQELTQP